MLSGYLLKKTAIFFEPFPLYLAPMKKILVCLSAMCLCIISSVAQEKIDGAMMQKIKQEASEHSQVMKIAFSLTDSSGPRLTASPGFDKAANYAKNKLTEWGLVNAKLDPWGDFGKGWELKKFYLALTAPYYKPINAFVKAWCVGTNGLKNAEVLLITAADSAGLEAYKGKLSGKIIIEERDFTYQQSFQPDARRYTEAELEAMQNTKPRPANVPAVASRRNNTPTLPDHVTFFNYLKKLAREEGAVAILNMNSVGHDGTLFVQGGGSFKKTDPENFTDLQTGMEDYMTIVRLLKAGVPVTMDIEVDTRFYTDDTQGYNVIAEIPGTDKKLKDEVVMLGAHLDSWQGSMGATDNAAGSIVMLEAIRILKALNIQPKRTIRIALWSGEEQGLLGSKSYVKKIFGDPATMQLLPAHQKFSSYFNIDNGTGKIRGIYLQENEACRPIFEEWFKPFNDMGAKTITNSTTGGTDHLSFDAVGLPGFQFIQDPIEYATRTHHTTMDSYDHLIENDLKQMAAIISAFVYNASQRTEKLPRKELPKPPTNQPANF